MMRGVEVGRAQQVQPQSHEKPPGMLFKRVAGLGEGSPLQPFPWVVLSASTVSWVRCCGSASAGLCGSPQHCSLIPGP